jgi:release factor glutamine methyltransferase
LSAEWRDISRHSPSDPTTRREDAGELVERLRAAGCVFAEDEADLLLAAGGPVEELVARRSAGEPLEHLLGWASFCGRRVVVEPGVFVPRRRTELLAALALPHVSPGTVVVDLCCGTGAIGVVLAEHGAEVHGVDVDPAAVHCARRNLERVYAGDLYAALPSRLRGRVDVIVANAPYVPTGALALMPPEARDHEPRRALDGGADGLDVQRRIVTGAAAWLRPGGHLVLETSATQARAGAALLEAAGMSAQIHRDDDRDATAVLATAP